MIGVVSFTESKAVGFELRTYAITLSTPLNPPDIEGKLCSLSYVGEGWGEVFV